jgi:hypothetical protein
MFVYIRCQNREDIMNRQFNFGKVVRLLCYCILVLVALLWMFEKPNHYKESQDEKMIERVPSEANKMDRKYKLWLDVWLPKPVTELESTSVTVPCKMEARRELLDKEEKLEKTPRVFLAPEEQEDFIRRTFRMIGYISIVVKGDCIEDTTVKDTYDVAKQEAMKMGADVIIAPISGSFNEETTQKFFFYWCYKQRRRSSFEPYKDKDYHNLNRNRKYEI